MKLGNMMRLFTKKDSNIPRRRQVDKNIAEASNSDVFKRNRTLTVTTTSDYLENLNTDQSKLESSRAHAHNLTNRRRQIFGIFLAVILFVVLLLTLIGNFTSTIEITTPNATIPKSIDSLTYSNIIQEYFNDNPLSRFRFWLNEESLTNYVVNKLPEVDNVSQANMVGIGRYDYALTMRIPVAGWKIGDKQYYVDASGVAFEKNYFAAPSVQIIDNSGAQLQSGEVSVSKRFMAFVGLVVSLSKSSGYIVTTATIPYNTTRQLEIGLQGVSAIIKMSIDRPVGEQVEDMSRAVQYFVEIGRSPSYVDVRVSGRAYYL